MPFSICLVYIKHMKKMKVYYDNLCLACSAEINHYKKQIGSEKIEFIDITSSQFNAEAEGLDPFAVHKIMHARKADGSLVTKVEAFIAIWEQLPKYQWLYNASQKKSVRFLMDQGYIAFATIRPYLPKRKKMDCSQSPYCELHTANHEK